MSLLSKRSTAKNNNDIYSDNGNNIHSKAIKIFCDFLHLNHRKES